MKINTLYNKDKRYPSTLIGVNDSPQQLHYRGNLPDDYDYVVAIVGTRKPSAYGIAITERLAAELAQKGVWIVSGLALGIDAVAHKATVGSGGKTIAVVPSDLQKIYPVRHTQLSEQIVESGGAVMSEHRSKASIQKYDFLHRNRLIAGISQLVIVVESAAKGGSLNTAMHALEQGKPVFAVPGNITSPTSTGTNELIKNGAHVVTSASDILLSLGLHETNTQTVLQIQDEQQLTVVNLLRSGVTFHQDLLLKSKLSSSKLNQLLTELEINGSVSSAGNGRWISKI